MLLRPDGVVYSSRFVMWVKLGARFDITGTFYGLQHMPPIVRRLEKYPQLRIQDLTLKDLWTYAEGRLRFPTLYSGDQHEQARHGIIRGLVKKAEGVFLWLCLAVKSLNAGLDNEDHLEEVAQRAECLPSDLARLYMDMWNRLMETMPSIAKTLPCT